MRRALLVLAACLVVTAAGLYAVRGRGVSARPAPSALEVRAALLLRSWLTPPRIKTVLNPVTVTPQVLAAAREHFADHCASCHGNDGSGRTAMGQALYPKAPDMREARTQQLSDGELFYFIENGIRLTGMPGWGTGTPEGETASWSLVHFIRHLPSLTPADIEEMERLNPRSREEIEEEQKADDFLTGGEPPPAGPDPHAGHRQP